MMQRLLRGIAVAIAIAGVVDPAVTSNRTVKPIVSVVGSTDAARTRAAAALSDHFTVLDAPFSGAAATVIVGDRLPGNARDFAEPVVAVLPTVPASGIRITALHAAPTSVRGTTTHIALTAAVRGGRGDTLVARLVSGNAVVDEERIAVPADSALVPVRLAFVPVSNGMKAVRVRLSFARSTRNDTAVADVATNVVDRRMNVLFFDTRPSWMSTFVRRTLESDERFEVVSRVLTSRGISTQVGQPPQTLTDVAALRTYDAIVVGAPEGLSAADIVGLEQFMRVRGGSVLLLFDVANNGASLRLTGVSAWRKEATEQPTAIASAVDGDSLVMRAREWMTPTRLPVGASLLATVRTGTSATRADNDAPSRAIVFSQWIGRGLLVTSGALDAWRFRDPSTSGFDRYWRTLIADAAANAVPPVDVSIVPALARPGDSLRVIAAVRDVPPHALSIGEVADVAIDASLGSLNEPPQSLRMMPTATPGQFEAVTRAPQHDGTYVINVRTRIGMNSDSASRGVIVSKTALGASPAEAELVAMLAEAHGGFVIHEPELSSLAARLAGFVKAAPRTVTWYPMHSFWWLLPFALALGTEWWLRRRGGRA